MKFQPVQPKATNSPQKTDPSLSNEAFYLIAIALLLKKESGNRSMLHYLVPGMPATKKPKVRH